ncbi:hypothetical protein jhhlp_001213 [Lomentospora prolificans]|uniref:TM7S3/TM198-like domain-containing protein n=1 Tax=Lomentospora prolificans TaxID=41688 RepID=A0A2N3NHL4_9PEZI|nr:hypothetical protein jhhlp_001213 [Lomentospora prolificans]
MLPRWSRRLALLFCLFLCIQFTTARRPGLIRRQDNVSPEPAPETTVTAAPGSTATATDGPTEDKEPTATQSTSSTTTSAETLVPTLINNPGTDDGYNAPIPEGELPIQPRITPAYGLAGVFLLASGLVHTTIGIKNSWLQTFFSVTYLGNLATTVLIIYVMTVPVSDAIQGAYLVAVVLTGVILGAAATIFKELTEGLGCILGGFCVSMWLLTLVPGGLLPQTLPKVIFITAFSLGSFCFYFSHYTRDYAQIFLLAFSGATAAVLGIDCFSRAGLKEFWAYVWDLNENLFPFNAETYPVTKGIRVEAAAVIIITIAGIISQLKLWRVIQQRRAKKAAEKAEDERNLQAEEEAIGRQVEEANARDRRDWERVYGDGDGQTIGSSHSGSGNLEKEKQVHVASPVPISSQSSTRTAGETELRIEMAERTSVDLAPDVPPKSPPPPLMATEEGDARKVMVRVVPEEYPAPDRGAMRDPEEMAWVPDEGRIHQPPFHRDSIRVSRSMTTSPQPDVIPLPFHVTEDSITESEADRQTTGARSSLAGTFADDDERPQSKRSSLVKRLSQGSASFFQGLSHRGDKNPGGNGVHGSQEELVNRRSLARTEDDNGSVVATIDIESVDDDRSTVRGEVGEEIEINAELTENNVTEQASDGLATDTPTGEAASGSAAASEVTSKPKNVASEAGTTREFQPDDESVSKKGKSISSKSSSQLAVLTKDALPEPLSRTALKYRTNEWVKHSTGADTPEPDEIQLEEYPKLDKSDKGEDAVPVNVDELQQTAENGAPKPAQPIRAATAMSNYGRSMSRSDLRLSTHSTYEQGPPRRTSSSLQPAIPEEPDVRSSTATPAPDGGRSVSRNSTSPGPGIPAVVPYANVGTLMGQRETYIRNKALGPYPLQAAGVDYSMPLDQVQGDAGSIRNYSPYPSRAITPDEDDIPLSQRRALIRQSSLLGLSSTSVNPRASSANYGGAAVSTDIVNFNSHQPQRISSVPTPAVREAALANFRQSVAQDLRSGTPVIPSNGRESALGGIYGASSTSLNGGHAFGLGLSRDAEVRRTIEMQRSMMLREKEAEAQAKEAERWEKERNERAFEQMMRSGNLLDAHREAMRRLQGTAREK